MLAAAPAVPFTTTQFADATITPINPLPVAQTTGEKPQSKLWTYDGDWFCVMPDKTGTWIWRLDGTTWTQILRLAAKTTYHADVLPQGDLVHILLVDASNRTISKLASVQYLAALHSYEPWSVRPDLATVPLSKSDEAATLAIDSTGRMWIASDVTTTIEVRHSAYPYLSFSAPITIGSGIKKDDISVITAMPDGEIGVLWSNQSAKRFYFRTHQDGNDPANWSAIEMPAAQSALKVGAGMADDHLNLAVGADGTVYAAIKTGYDSAGKTQIGLLIRRPDGAWDPLYTVDTGGTRPLILVDDAIGRLMVVYTTATRAGDVVFRETPLDNISFSARTTLIRGSLDNVTSTKQNVTNQILVMAGNGQDKATKAFSALLTIPWPSDPGSTAGLQVDAGADQTIQLPDAAILHAVVTENGSPPTDPVSTKWTATSGPASVNFAQPTAPDTTAIFSVPGIYVLRFTADDGEKIVFDELTVVIDPNPLLSNL